MKREISEVVETGGRFVPRFTVTIDGREKWFSKKENAEAYRATKIAEHEEEQRAIEKEERERERKAEEARLRAEYDLDPEYVTRFVWVPSLVDDRHDHIRREYMDLSACAKKLDDACFRLSQGGYEVLSVTPITSSYASTGGWGLVYTGGVVIIGRKKPASE